MKTEIWLHALNKAPFQKYFVREMLFVGNCVLQMLDITPL